MANALLPLIDLAENPVNSLVAVAGSVALAWSFLTHYGQGGQFHQLQGRIGAQVKYLPPIAAFPTSFWNRNRTTSSSDPLPLWEPDVPVPLYTASRSIQSDGPSPVQQRLPPLPRNNLVEPYPLSSVLQILSHPASSRWTPLRYFENWGPIRTLAATVIISMTLLIYMVLQQRNQLHLMRIELLSLKSDTGKQCLLTGSVDSLLQSIQPLLDADINNRLSNLESIEMAGIMTRLEQLEQSIRASTQIQSVQDLLPKTFTLLKGTYFKEVRANEAFNNQKIKLPDGDIDGLMALYLNLVTCALNRFEDVVQKAGWDGNYRSNMAGQHTQRHFQPPQVYPAPQPVAYHSTFTQGANIPPAPMRQFQPHLNPSPGAGPFSPQRPPPQP